MFARPVRRYHLEFSDYIYSLHFPVLLSPNPYTTFTILRQQVEVSCLNNLWGTLVKWSLGRFRWAFTTPTPFHPLPNTILASPRRCLFHKRCQMATLALSLSLSRFHPFITLNHSSNLVRFNLCGIGWRTNVTWAPVAAVVFRYIDRLQWSNLADQRPSPLTTSRSRLRRAARLSW